MGFVLVRNIMCGAIYLTQDINDRVREQVVNLFGTSEGSEIACVGQGTESVSVFPESENLIICSIRAKEAATYQFSIRPDADLSDIDSATIQKWLSSNTNTINGVPGDDEPRKIARFIIPETAPEGHMSVTVEVRKSGESSPIYSRELGFEVTRKGVIRSVVC